MEVISDQELFDDMRVRLSERHNVVIEDNGEIGGSGLGKIKDVCPSYYWRSSLPILRAYHTDPKFTAFFGILDVLSTVPKEDIYEEEKPVDEPKKEPDEEIEIEYDLETEQQYYAAEWIKDIPTPVLYRMTVAGKRVYYEMGADGSPIIYDGATNNIANGYCDTSGALEKWKNEMRLKGKDPDEYANYRADLGTIMHYLFGLYLTGVKIKLIPTWIRKAVNGVNLMAEVVPGYTDVKEDLTFNPNGPKYQMNVGMEYSFWKDYINAVIELNRCKYFSGGIYFKIHLK